MHTYIHVRLDTRMYVNYNLSHNEYLMPCRHCRENP